MTRDYHLRPRVLHPGLEAVDVERELREQHVDHLLLREVPVPLDVAGAEPDLTTLKHSEEEKARRAGLVAVRKHTSG